MTASSATPHPVAPPPTTRISRGLSGVDPTREEMWARLGGTTPFEVAIFVWIEGSTLLLSFEEIVTVNVVVAAAAAAAMAPIRRRRRADEAMMEERENVKYVSLCVWGNKSEIVFKD